MHIKGPWPQTEPAPTHNDTSDSVNNGQPPPANTPAPLSHTKRPYAAPQMRPEILHNIIRARRNKSTLQTWIAKYTNPTHGVRDVCQSYTNQEYASMANDTTRNKAYQMAIKALPRHRINLDIGTGNEALLSKIILRYHTTCIAVEAAENTAKKAKRALQQCTVALGKQWQVLHAYSTDMNLVNKAHEQYTHKAVNVIHEIIGPIASMEGAPKALHALLTHNRGTPHPINFCPVIYGTFITPITIDPAKIQEKTTYLQSKLVHNEPYSQSGRST